MFLIGEIMAMRIRNTFQNSTAVLAHPFNAVTTVHIGKSNEVISYFWVDSSMNSNIGIFMSIKN